MSTRSIAVIVMLAALLACDTANVPGDLSVEASETDGVIFSEDFESGSLDNWPDGVDETLHQVVTRPGSAQSGDRYLSVRFPKDGDGGWLTTFFMPGYDSLYVSYYVRFPDGWKGSPKLVGFYGSRIDDQYSGLGKASLCPDGTDFFVAMLVTEPEGDPGPPRFYTYFPGMSREPDGTTCWGRYGDGSEHYASSKSLSRGDWHHVEFNVELNTPGKRDARQAFWIDGELRGRWEGFSLRNSDVLRLNGVQLTFSLSDGSPRDQELHVDNLVVRRTR